MVYNCTAHLISTPSLPQANDMLEGLFDQMPSDILVLTRDRHLLHFNAMRIDYFKHYSSTIAQTLRSRISG